MESFTAKQPEIPKDFNLIFSGRKFPVSKFKLMLFSQKFLKLLENFENDSFEFEEKTTLAIFKEFIKAAQGEEFELTKENATDMFKLSKNWEIKGLSAVIEEFMKANDIKTKETEKIDKSEEIFEIFAKNLDKAVKVPSFGHLPLSDLEKILGHKNVHCEDYHSLFNFVISMLNLHGPKATSLALTLDTSKLPSDDMIQLLENQNLDKKTICSSSHSDSKILRNGYIKARERLQESRDQYIKHFQSKHRTQKKLLKRSANAKMFLIDSLKQKTTLRRTLMLRLAY